ncbi:MAG: aldehyde dehydrogenase family protein, partial [Pseudomonadota bacterium]|nr:aldehyde dehydrogenase family protein [Pseudomonadota bacterium]
GIWTRDVANAMRVAGRIEAGTVYINNYFNAAAQSPVGGYKQSGVGREGGAWGIEEFLEIKTISGIIG